jgi:glycine/D-amino acid oxidase-like deaminating enzyme
MFITDIVIIGGGVIGSSIAYHLARAGRSVIVVERGGIAAAPSASWASAGGVRRQGRLRAEIALANESSARWKNLADELDADLEFRAGGNLMLAESEAYATRVAAFVERQHRNGLREVVLMDRKQVREIVPGIAAQVIAGSYSPGDGHANPVLTTRAFAVAAQRLGAEYWTATSCASLLVGGRRVSGARTSRGDIDAATTVLAAGAWSIKLAAEAGLVLPMRIEALQMISSTPAPAISLTPVLSSLGRALSLKQLPAGSFLLGGGWLGDLAADGDSYQLIQKHLDGNWDAACSILPAVGEQRLERAWCGLEATSLDDLPLVGTHRQLDNLVLATGFSGHGFAIAPAIGSAVADLIMGNPSASLESLSPDRFPR